VVLQICWLKRKVCDLAFALFLNAKRIGGQRKRDFAPGRKARKASQSFLFHRNSFVKHNQLKGSYEQQDAFDERAERRAAHGAAL
jgi:hypothetical protein